MSKLRGGEGTMEEFLAQIENDPEELYNFGVWLCNEDPPVYQMALEMFTKAAKFNHADSFAMLGLMLYYGNGVPQDKKFAKDMLTNAKNFGSSMGARYLRELKFGWFS